MELTRDQKMFMLGARCGACDMSPRILQMDDETVWSMIKAQFAKADALLPNEVPTGNGESPVADAVRSAVGRGLGAVAATLTSNTESPKHTRSKR
jgi:ketosteroid isomerase-like protein